MTAESTAPLLGFLGPPLTAPDRFPSADPSCGSLRGQQPGHPNEIVRGSDDVGPLLRSLHPAIARPPQPADRLSPAKDLLHSLPDPPAPPIARMTRRPTVDVRSAPARVLRHVRSHPSLSQALDEGCDVVALVRPQRPGSVAAIRHASQQSKCLFPFGRARRSGDRKVDAQAIAV